MMDDLLTSTATEVLPPWLHIWLPFAAVMALLFVLRLIMHKVFTVQKRNGVDIRYRQQGSVLLLGVLAVVLAISTLPMDGELRGQLLSLVGLLVSAAIALSSTSFMGNLMAGFMLRVVSSFRAGDYIEFRGELGRVSQLGLLHVEIQNETSELVTVPNLLLVQEPHNVVRASGTVISADVSLGYDVDRRDVETALLSAIAAAELENGFVQLRELGDFSVTYRASGWLKEASVLVSTRSRLRAMMLDALHSAQIEIVSPNFMNQRQLDSDGKLIPQRRRRHMPEQETTGHAEGVLFNKAELASAVEALQAKISKIKSQLSNDDGEEELDRNQLKEELTTLTEELEEARQLAKDEHKRDREADNDEDVEEKA